MKYFTCCAPEDGSLVKYFESLSDKTNEPWQIYAGQAMPGFRKFPESWNIPEPSLFNSLSNAGFFTKVKELIVEVPVLDANHPKGEEHRDSMRLMVKAIRNAGFTGKLAMSMDEPLRKCFKGKWNPTVDEHPGKPHTIQSVAEYTTIFMDEALSEGVDVYSIETWPNHDLITLFRYYETLGKLGSLPSRVVMDALTVDNAFDKSFWPCIKRGWKNQSIVNDMVDFCDALHELGVSEIFFLVCPQGNIHTQEDFYNSAVGMAKGWLKIAKHIDGLGIQSYHSDSGISEDRIAKEKPSLLPLSIGEINNAPSGYLRDMTMSVESYTLTDLRSVVKLVFG